MTPHEYTKWYHEKFKQNQDHSHLIEDYEVYITLIEKHKIESVLEIGCWLGDTALLMYLHPQIKRLKTLDIHKDMDLAYRHKLHELHPKEHYGVKIRYTNAELEFIDSRTYDTKDHYDMIFIDGNHQYEFVKSDTMLALRLKPKLIVWHDYGGGNWDVIKYIDELIAEGWDIKKGVDLGFPRTIVVYYEC